MRGQRPLGNAAQTLDPDQAAVLDLADHEPKLIHMGEEHHRRCVGVAVESGDQVAEDIRAAGQSCDVELCGDGAAHAVLVAGQAGDQHEFGEVKFDPLTHHAPRAARARAMKSPRPVGIDRIPGVAVDLERGADDAAIGDAEDVGDGGVLDAGVGEDRGVGEDLFHRFEVAEVRRLAGDLTRDQHRVGDAGEHSTAGTVGQRAAVEAVGEFGGDVVEHRHVAVQAVAVAHRRACIGVQGPMSLA